MKIWKLGVLALIGSGLVLASGLSGCGDDNPCDPDPCNGIENAVPGSCLAVGTDDFACICQDFSAPIVGGEKYRWDETNKECVPG